MTTFHSAASGSTRRVIGPAEKSQDQAGNEGEGEGEINADEQQVPPDEHGAQPWSDQQAFVDRQRLDHASSPSFALVRQAPQRIGCVRPGDRVLRMARFVTHAK